VARWIKLLQRMLADAYPVGYTYAEVAAVLAALGFEVAPSRGGSHRKWRLRTDAGNTVIVGLVEKGSGTLKPYLIRDLIAQLRLHGLIPKELQ
jgi:predicted RNA binding protein YcfA (HicA-like mRNA interferase family)